MTDYKVVKKTDGSRVGYVDYEVHRDDGVVIKFDRRGHGSCRVQFAGHVINARPPNLRLASTTAREYADACGTYFTRRTVIVLLRDHYREIVKHFEQEMKLAREALEKFETDVGRVGELGEVVESE